jgi:pimeloyl-ACP methyl ester carboxylesterase
MPRRTPKSAKPASSSSSQPLVGHGWLIKAIAAVVIVALICAYLTLALLFYQGQWQLVLHPKHETQAPENSSIHFAPDESATPQLTGRWIPAALGARYANATILFLPSGDGSLSDFNTTLDRLHNLGVNIFAFDYRGYGYSADTHPNQLRMTQDAESAWSYLITSRGIPAHQIIPYGVGVGASLATHLAAIHSDIPALILESPKGDLLDTVRHDPHVPLMPVRLLFHENFPLAEQLASLHTPKLLISKGGTAPAFPTASDPKLTAKFDPLSDATYAQTLTRFLDQYVAPPTQQLVPTPAPASTNPH